MAWLNYHHLFYFWNVAREGGISRAAAHLRLTEPTISSQIRELERAIGQKLFERQGRALVLTEAGRLAYRYANDIFTLGREFQAAMSGATAGKGLRLRVGVADAVPRLVAFRLLEPATKGSPPTTVVCQSDVPHRLLVKLVTDEVDLVISDAPLDSGGRVRLHNRLLGESGVTFFAAPELTAALRQGFPKSLHHAPFLAPAEGTTLRRSLDAWFEENGLRPVIRAEFTDSALLKTFGRASLGVFAAPTAIEAEVRREYRVRVVGRAPSLRERFYVISANRKLQHPAVAAISHSARTRVFG